MRRGTRRRRPCELGPDLLPGPPHRSRDRLAEIEAGILGSTAQLLDLTLERRRQLERDRFAFLFAFENSHRSSPSRIGLLTHFPYGPGNTRSWVTITSNW